MKIGECPRCDSREIENIEKRERAVIEDWPHDDVFEIVYYLCKACDLVFGERLW